MNDDTPIKAYERACRRSLLFSEDIHLELIKSTSPTFNHTLLSQLYLDGYGQNFSPNTIRHGTLVASER